MAPRQLRNLRQANLFITNKTIKIDAPLVIYQVKNIASIDKRIKEPEKIFNNRLLTFASNMISLFPMGFAVLILISIFLFPFILPLLLIYWLIKGKPKFLERKIPKILYGVSISTSDGKFLTIYDMKEEFIDNIISRIYEVMENQAASASYHFAIEGDMIQQSGNFGIGINQGSIN